MYSESPDYSIDPRRDPDDPRDKIPDSTKAGLSEGETDIPYEDWRYRIEYQGVACENASMMTYPEQRKRWDELNRTHPDPSGLIIRRDV